MTITNRGMVVDLAPTSQFYAGETEFACGFYTAALARYAGRPGYGPMGTPAQVRAWAEQHYIAVYGSDAANQTGGVSIDQMHAMYHDAGNHYWDIVAINPNSQRADDIRRIKAALMAGYPVDATVMENSVRDLTGDIPAGSPYEWNPSGTHVITWVGVAPDGNLLAADPANVVGPLQGVNHTRSWPRKYDISTINNTWASVIQLVGPDAAAPWMRAFPQQGNGDPLGWPAGFNAQNFQAAGGTSWMNSHQAKQAEDYWNSTTIGDIPTGGNAPVPAGIFPAGHAPNYETGIALAWQSEYQAARVWGPPLTYEFETVNWDGNSIVTQMFAAGRCEWDGSPHWYHW